MYGSRSSAEKNAGKQLKEILEHMSPSTCRIGFWTSDVISSETQFPLKMRKPILWNAGQSSVPAKTNALNGNGKAQGSLDRNVMCIVEIWSKNPRVDAKNRLIARQIQHNNVFMDTDATHSDWFYGGKTLELPSSLSGSFDSAKSSMAASSSLKDSPNRRNDKLHSKLSAAKQISALSGSKQPQSAYSHSKPHPFSTWISPASIYAYVPSMKTQSVFPTYSNPTKPKLVHQHQQQKQQHQQQQQSQAANTMSFTSTASTQSVFKYKFRWHVKAINRKSLISRDRGSSLPSENISGLEAAAGAGALSVAVAVPFGYHDEEDDLAALNLTVEGCPQGYQGADCSVPVCLTGCDQDHG